MAFINLIADVPENEADNILDNIGKDVIAEYMRTNGYKCEIE